MTITVPPPDVGRPEWLRWRRSGLGASDIAGVLDISPYASPWSVWADKVGITPPDDDDPSIDMEFGRRMEPAIAPWFEDLTGRHVAATQLWVTSDEIPWLLSTPDGVTVPRDYCTHGGLDCPFPSHRGASHGRLPLRADDVYALLELAEGEDTGLEIKVAWDSKAWAEIPAHYEAQGQQQMFTAGWELVWFAVLHGRRLREYRLERDEADIQVMIERAGEFWERYVLARVPPPIDDSNATFEAIKAAYPGVDVGSSKALDHVQGAITDLAQAKADAKDAERREKGAQSVLRDAMGDAEIGTVAGLEVLTLRSQTRRTICRHCHTVDETDPFRVLRLTPTSKETA